MELIKPYSKMEKYNFNKHILVLEENDSIRICAIDDKKLELCFSCPKRQDEAKKGNVVSSIYVGRVDYIVDNLNAAFVKYQNVEDKQYSIGYLPFSEIISECVINRHFKTGDRLKGGDLVIVQILKAPVKTKQATLTMKLSLSSKITAITLGKRGIGCSRKLSESDKDSLLKECKKNKELLSFLEEHDNMPSRGLILRTELSHRKNEESVVDDIFNDSKALTDTLTDIINKGKHLSIGTCLYMPQTDDIISRYLKACFDFFNQDSKNEIEIIAQTCSMKNIVEDSVWRKENPDILVREWIDENVSLNVLYRISSQLDEIKKKNVWLNSGAYLVVESTEAMHVIDVNTGKSIKQKGNLFLQINIEAAKEILRQIRLRNLTGMIMVDFINMQSQKDYSALKDVIITECKKDYSHVRFVDFTLLGIGEFIRSRTEK